MKEVKTLRTQLDSIREERDLYRNQLDLMRQALGGGGFVATPTVAPNSSKAHEFNEKEKSTSIWEGGSGRATGATGTGRRR